MLSGAGIFSWGTLTYVLKGGKVVVDVSEVQSEQDFLCWATMLRPSEALGPQKVVVVAKSQGSSRSGVKRCQKGSEVLFIVWLTVHIILIHH